MQRNAIPGRISPRTDDFPITRYCSYRINYKTGVLSISGLVIKTGELKLHFREL